MKIVIAGTGAMGAVYGSLLKKAGNEVDFIDKWQENINEINKNGITLNNLGNIEKINVKAYLPSQYSKEVDLIILFTKSMQLKSMLEDIKHLLSKDTQVLCLLNGLGHIDTLKQFVDENNILMGVTVLTASMSSPGNFSVTNYGNTEIQNIGNNEKQAKEVIKTLNEANLLSEYSENVLFSIWRKACINGTMNSCCALLECNILKLGEIDDVNKLFKSIVKEFSDIAYKEGVVLNVDEITDLTLFFTTKKFKGVNHYPSMYQDLILNHRLTEIDYLNGYVSRKGKEYNIETKYCDLITLLIHGKEKILLNN